MSRVVPSLAQPRVALRAPFGFYFRHLPPTEESRFEHLYRPKLNELASARLKARAEANKKAAQPFLEKAAAEKGAKKTASGLVYTELKAGSGDAPTATDTVKVHYTGTLADGTVFEAPSSAASRRPSR